MRKLLILLNITFFIISFILLPFAGRYNYAILYLIVGMSLVSLCSYFVYTGKQHAFKGQYLRISYIFIIGYAIVFLQNNIDLLLGYKSVNSECFASSETICICALYSLIGLLSYIFGFVTSKNYYSGLSYNKRHDLITLMSDKYLLIQRILFFIFVSIYLFFNALKILSGNYYYNEQTMFDNAGSLLNYSIVMIDVLMFTILCSNVYNLKIKKIKLSFGKFIRINGLIFNIPMLIYLSFVFMTGDRGPILTAVLAFSITYVIACGKKLSFSFLLVMLVIGSIFFSVIGQMRRESNLLSLSEMITYKNSENNKSIMPATSELAGSYNTFTYSVDRVPSRHPFFYGILQLRSIGYSVPFLYRFIPFVYSDKNYENNSVSYCTYLIQGLNRTYGNGTSILADIYLDFGLIGIIVIMFIIGRLVIRLDYELFYGVSSSWFLVAVIFFSYSLYLSRSTLSTPLYYIVPSCIVFYCRKYIK